MLAHRSLKKVIGAALQKRHYKALVNMGLLSGSFLDTLTRYLTGKGTYPFRVPIKTPLGTIHPKLYSYYDLLTVNEIFFREDYGATADDRVIVDIGSNIGLSALYFLTRNDQAVCHLFEPDPRNIERLKENIAPFASRCVVNEFAVGDTEGNVRFGLDVISGRYGGLKSEFGHYTTVKCVHINHVLTTVLKQSGNVDILKIDTEGTEHQILQAIDGENLRNVRKIYCEAPPANTFHPDRFDQVQYGTVCQLIKKG